MLTLIEHRLQKSVQFCWGGMDALVVGVYVLSSVRRGRIPYWEDIENVIELARNHSQMALWFGATVILVHLSVIASAVLFIKGVRVAPVLGLIQAPFRIFLLPSIPLSLFWPDVLFTSAPWLMVALGVMAEVVKFTSLIWLLKLRQRNVLTPDTSPRARGN